MLAADGVNFEDTLLPPFIADMESKTSTFQGDNDADGDDGRDDKPVLTKVDAVGSSGDAIITADTTTTGGYAREMPSSNFNVVKKPRLGTMFCQIEYFIFFFLGCKEYYTTYVNDYIFVDFFSSLHYR